MSARMQLVERHIIKPTDTRWEVIDAVAFLSKNLWNYANYLKRQTFIKEGKWLSYNYLAGVLKQQADYTALPRKVSQQVLIQLEQAWQDWSQSMKAYQINPSAFQGRPRLPGYKHKTKGRNKLTYTRQALSKPKLRQGIVKPSGVDIAVKTQIPPEAINQVRIIPPDQKTSRRIQRLTHKRNMKINDYLHKASFRLIDWCVEQGIGTLVVGKNDGWKQAIGMGKRNNQNFVHVPHARFIKMLQYKGELAGVEVILTEESYTSKCSFLDNEPLHKHEQYGGRRIQRGLFRSQNGVLLNADINAAANIIRKAIPNAVANGIEGVVVHPVLVLPA